MLWEWCSTSCCGILGTDSVASGSGLGVAEVTQQICLPWECDCSKTFLGSENMGHLEAFIYVTKDSHGKLTRPIYVVICRNFQGA
jgi:hypothetical protein